MAVFETIFPILVIVLLGFLSANRKHLSQNECDAISKFVFCYVIPIMLFVGTVNAKLPDKMEWEFLYSYYAALLFVYFIAVIIAKFIFNFSAPEQSVFSMGASYSNSTIVGIPICLYTLGEGSLLPLFVIVSVHNLILFTVGMIVAERNSFTLASFFKNILNILKLLLTSPITLSLILGGIVNIFNIPIYLPLKEGITLMSNAAVPTALFVLGTSLNKYHIKGHISPALVIVFLKIILFPILVWLLVFNFFTIDPLWASTALLTSAMPVGISAYIFSQQYKACEAPVTTSIVISTIASILTLSVLIPYVQSIN